ncbi:MAG: thymidine phosphorylase [Clostridia bacterium]
MRIYDIISNKRDKKELTNEEIAFFVQGYTKGEIKSYHASALLMAIYLNGMSKNEMFTLTKEMANSGDTIDLSSIDGITADKHSTGGVGDKTTLIVAPIVAALGIKVAKMSGRGLGHTGGTVDKLESITGFDVALSVEEFFENVRKIGICVVGQTGNLAPADKKIYALRDATATVANQELIASSIMSKKLAAGSQCIVLDVKVGSGAFMKTLEDATELSQKMVEIGTSAGRKVRALITDMDTPLGKNIGNTLEVIEAVQLLKNPDNSDLMQVSKALAANIAALSLNISIQQANEKVCEVLGNGSAYKKFFQMVQAQHGDTKLIENTDLFEKASIICEVKAESSGYIKSMDAEKIGSSSVILGAGRVNKDDVIDYTAGIELLKKTGDFVENGEVLAVLHTNKKEVIEEAKELFISAFEFSQDKTTRCELIFDVIG